MSDEITITLPVSGKEVVIRNYTTRGDDKESEAALYSGVKTTSDDNGKPTLEFPLSSVMGSTEVYVRRLIKTIDGESKNITDLLENLRTEDYKFIEDAINKIVENNSPKVPKVGKV